MTSEVERITVSGVDLVMIPAAEYAALLEAKARLSEISFNHQQLSTPRKGVIDRNPEVAVFLAQRFGLRPMGALLRECKRTYGAKRTPSRSAAYRYWERLRIEAREAQRRGEGLRPDLGL